MDYYLINTMPCSNRDYVFLEKPPEGTLAIDYRMAKGQPMGTDYPEDARVYQKKMIQALCSLTL